MTPSKRPLGNAGLSVGPLAFGGNVFGWTIDEAASFPLLDAFVAAGFNLVDTADVYSRWHPGNQGGESETIIGNWLKNTGQRSKIVLATKVGMEMGSTEKGLSRTYILQAVERSLNRLQTDTIDLYQAHRDDETTPLEETLGVFNELIQQGKVKAIGASNYSAARLAEALAVSHKHGYARFECLQPHYNLCERALYEPDLEPLCVKEGLAVIPYFALASGFLTGKYRTEADLAKFMRGSRVKKYLNERGLSIVAALDEVAMRYKTTAAQIAIAWLMSRSSVTAPIASATTIEQLDTLIAATKLQLDATAIELLNQASA